MNTVKINSFINGTVAATTICFCLWGSEPTIVPNSVHDLINSDYGVVAKSISENQYYTHLNQNDIIMRETEIIHGFISDLIEKSYKTPSSFSKAIDEHFWEMA